jgi:hypothetical protein
MRWVRFEPTIPAFYQGTTFHALDRDATVISSVAELKEILEQLSVIEW